MNGFDGISQRNVQFDLLRGVNADSMSVLHETFRRDVCLCQSLDGFPYGKARLKPTFINLAWRAFSFARPDIKEMT